MISETCTTHHACACIEADRERLREEVDEWRRRYGAAIVAKKLRIAEIATLRTQLQDAIRKAQHYRNQLAEEKTDGE